MISFGLYLAGSIVLLIVALKRGDASLALASALFVAGGVAGLVL